MSKTSFYCKVITPDAKLLDEPVTSVILPAWDGQMGFLPNRAPIVAKLGTGELRISFADAANARGGDTSYLIQDGFLKMVDNQLTILTNKALPARSINLAEAKAEAAEADARKPERMTPHQADRLKRERDFAHAKVRLGETFKSSGGAI